MLHADILTLGFKGGWDMKPYQQSMPLIGQESIQTSRNIATTISEQLNIKIENRGQISFSLAGVWYYCREFVKPDHADPLRL